MTLARPSATITLSTILVSIVVLLSFSPAAAAVCGNGVVETGEDCDDGSSQNGGTNSCCTGACTFSGKSPDVIVGDLTGTSNWGAVGTISAFSVGTTSCNLGSCWLNWIANTAEHPVIGQNMYRLKGGRFEQIGQSWLKHGFTALAGNVCSNSCVTPPNGNHLGVNCSDPYGSGLNGDQTRLGPKEDVNANTGVFLYPDAREGTTGNAIFKHLQVHNTDLDAASNPGALYFVEGQYVTRDDAAAKMNPNNASYRPATVTFASGNYNLSLTGSTVRTKAGIQAWKATDPTVTELSVGAPEGVFILSAKATALGGGIFHYEYALQNLTNQRAGQAFTVPIPSGTIVTNVGFHDVDYHSGEPFDGTDWTPTVSSNSVTWVTQTFAVNPNANALRWGTLYNFRFDANVAPGFAATVIGLFRPGAPTTVSAVTVAPNPCVGLANGTACTDGNACTQNDTCQSGVCQGATSTVCSASDGCHTAGTCDTATGICSNPTAPNGTGCTDGNACTQTDTCQSGVCQGANSVVCTASDACHNAGACAPATGVCSNPAKPNGSACNDFNVCTQIDTCQSGACAGSNPVVCTASDACHTAGTCAPATGVCSNPAKPNGSACNDGNACTQTDTCQSGACTGSSPVECTASDACHTAGTCAPATGACSDPTAPDGTACSDGDACTQSDACNSGVCAGSSPVVCTASDACHDAGTCSPATGSCSNPASADGTPCDDGNVCTANEACINGLCTGDGPQVPDEVDGGVQVSQSGGIATITWNSALGSTWSNVLRGLVSALPVGPVGGDEVCLVSGTADTFAIDAENPNPDEAFWYLINGTNACGKGPYGFQLQSGVPSPRVSTTCP